MGRKKFRINPADCLKTGTFFHGFLMAASRSPSVDVCFEGDENTEFSVSCFCSRGARPPWIRYHLSEALRQIAMCAAGTETRRAKP
jgi:hypothetical protein